MRSWTLQATVQSRVLEQVKDSLPSKNPLGPKCLPYFMPRIGAPAVSPLASRGCCCICGTTSLLLPGAFQGELFPTGNRRQVEACSPSPSLSQRKGSWTEKRVFLHGLLTVCCREGDKPEGGEKQKLGQGGGGVWEMESWKGKVQQVLFTQMKALLVLGLDYTWRSAIIMCCCFSSIKNRHGSHLGLGHGAGGRRWNLVSHVLFAEKLLPPPQLLLTTTKNPVWIIYLLPTHSSNTGQ